MSQKGSQQIECPMESKLGGAFRSRGRAVLQDRISSSVVCPTDRHFVSCRFPL